MMRRVTAHVALIGAVTLVLCSKASAQILLPPVIINAAAEGGLLTIHGANFGSGTPKVTLNSTDLVVQSASATDISAFLTPNLAPGNYLLVVYRAPNNIQFGVFVVTIGTQGPKGDKG